MKICLSAVSLILQVTYFTEGPHAWCWPGIQYKVSNKKIPFDMEVQAGDWIGFFSPWLSQMIDIMHMHISKCILDSHKYSYICMYKCLFTYIVCLMSE